MATLFRLGSILLGVAAAVLALAGTALGGKPITVPVSFDLGSATCSQLPAGTTIHGEGTAQFSETSSGTFHALINGTATDGGTTWRFVYHQNGNIAPDGSAQLTDHFNLVGSGTPIRLHTHFVIIFSATGEIVDAKQVTGDPEFCDPL
jgi:hypothetical protein